MQVMVSVRIPVEVQLDYFEVTLLQIVRVLFGQKVVPKYYEELLILEDSVESRLHVAVVQKFRWVGHVVEDHLPKDVGLVVLVIRVEDLIIVMVKSLLVLMPKIMHFIRYLVLNGCITFTF